MLLSFPSITPSNMKEVMVALQDFLEGFVHLAHQDENLKPFVNSESLQENYKPRLSKNSIMWIGQTEMERLLSSRALSIKKNDLLTPISTEDLYQFVQSEFMILFCIGLLARTTNKYIQKTSKSSPNPVFLDQESIYKTYHSQNHRASISTLLNKESLTIDEKSFMFTALSVAHLLRILSGFFCEFFGKNRDLLIASLDPHSSTKKKSIPSYTPSVISTSSIMSLGTSSTTIKKRRVLNIRL